MSLHLIGAARVEAPGTPAHRRLAARVLTVFLLQEPRALCRGDVITQLRLPDDDRSVCRVSRVMVWLYGRGLIAPIEGDQWVLRGAPPREAKRCER